MISVKDIGITGTVGKAGVYSGQIVKGSGHLRKGFGVIKFEDGGEYEGLWENDMPNRRGKFVYGNGDVYEG